MADQDLTAIRVDNLCQFGLHERELVEVYNPDVASSVDGVSKILCGGLVELGESVVILWEEYDG